MSIAFIGRGSSTPALLALPGHGVAHTLFFHSSDEYYFHTAVLVLLLSSAEDHHTSQSQFAVRHSMYVMHSGVMRRYPSVSRFKGVLPEDGTGVEP